MDSDSSSETSSPKAVTDSKGSSVSTTMREEYEDLLRYAVVTPSHDCRVPHKTTAPSPRAPSHDYPLPPVSYVEPVGNEGHQATTDDEGSSEQESVLENPNFSDQPTPSMTHTMTTPLEATSQLQQHQRHVSIIAPTASHLEHHGSNYTASYHHDDDVDPEVARLDRQLDCWCLDLKRNVLAEFEQARLRYKESYIADMKQERDLQNQEMDRLRNELERSRALLVTYEQSVSRKDQIISNLTQALDKQKEKVDLARAFAVWRTQHIDNEREMFTSALAIQHYRRKLQCRVFSGWFGILQRKWRQRVEKACQMRAEEVCHSLTNDYEEKLANCQMLYNEAQKEIHTLRQARDLCEQDMKKAFMRGVCALNMEAMTMFRTPDNIPIQPSTSNHDDPHMGGAEQEFENGQLPYPPPQKSCDSHMNKLTSHVTTSQRHATCHVSRPPSVNRGVAKNKGKPPNIMVERHVPK